MLQSVIIITAIAAAFGVLYLAAKSSVSIFPIPALVAPLITLSLVAPLMWMFRYVNRYVRIINACIASIIPFSIVAARVIPLSIQDVFPELPLTELFESPYFRIELVVRLGLVHILGIYDPSPFVIFLFIAALIVCTTIIICNEFAISCDAPPLIPSHKAILYACGVCSYYLLYPLSIMSVLAFAYGTIAI